MVTNKVYFYHTSPNQKCVITQKTQSDKDHIYALVNLEAVFTAAQELSDRAFKLYSRLNMHCDGYTYGLSPTEIQRTIGMSEDRYRTAVKELIKKGYLIQSDTQRNLYTFYEFPKRDAPTIAVGEQDHQPKTAASSGDIPRITPENQQDYPTRNHRRNNTNIKSHNTKDNTENTTSDGTSYCGKWLSSGEVIDDISAYISGNALEHQRTGTNLSGKGHRSDWMPAVRPGNTDNIIIFDEEDLPF